MNVQLPLQMDKLAFLAWVQGREERYELAEGRVVMMTGGTLAHAILVRRLLVLLDSKLNAKSWTVVADFGVDVGPTTLRYPDVMVAAVGDGAKNLTARAPSLIVEVISPSSEGVDLRDKADEYLRLPSLVAYVVFSQDEPKAWIWLRTASGFSPTPDLVARDSSIRVSALGIELPLSEIYRGIALD